MESFRTFFAGPNKDGNLTNNQRSGGLNLLTGRAMTSGMGGGLQGNLSPQMNDVDSKTHHDVKRKDSDNYFYIMWRS